MDIKEQQLEEQYNLHIEIIKSRLKTLIDKFQYPVNVYGNGTSHIVVTSQDILDNIDFIFMTEEK